jgi:hypothetical protein
MRLAIIGQIAVQGGSLELLKVRVEGGEKTSAAAFCAAQGLAVGDRLNAPATTQLSEPPDRLNGHRPAHSA